jgi:hypothetical protein
MQQQPPPQTPPTEPIPTLTKSSLPSMLQYQQLRQYSDANKNSTNDSNNNYDDNKKIHYGIAAPKRNTISYQQSCMLRPIASSLFFGSLYTMYSTVQQIMKQNPKSSSYNNQRRHLPQQQLRTGSITSALSSSTLLRTFGSSVGVIYLYYIIQCPMEAIQNKESYVHNGIAAFTLSYIGLIQQRIGIPFVSPYSIYELPLLARNLLGASIYSCMAMSFSALYGRKPY